MPDPGWFAAVAPLAALWLWATRHGRRHVWGGPEPSTLRDVRRD